MTASTQKFLPHPKDHTAIEEMSSYADMFVINLFNAIEQENLVPEFTAAIRDDEKEQSKFFHQTARKVIQPEASDDHATLRQAQAGAGVIHLEQVNLLTRVARRVMTDDAIAGKMPMIMGLGESLTLLERYAGPDAAQVAAKIRIPQIIMP